MSDNNALLFSIVAAALPVVLYVSLIYWVDRYEKEPLWLLSAAFLWGAVPAAILALIGNGLLSLPFYLALDSGTADAITAAAIAPTVEEVAKALLLFGILVKWRYELDSPLDGIIYGAMVGMGFAMVENVLYYQSAFREGGATTWNTVVFMRGVLFGLSHALYTALTGLGIAVSRQSRRPVVRYGAPFLGLAAAIALHTLHNLTMVGGTLITFLAGLTFDWGGILLTVALIVLVLRQERRWMARYLADEVDRGTLTTEEYDLVRSAAARNRLRWRILFTEGPASYRQAGQRWHYCSELAYRKHHYQLFGDPQSKAAIKELRQQIASTRQAESTS